MVSSRTATALVGLLASVAISVAVWQLTGSVVAFLFLPFLPVLLRGRGGDDAGDRQRPAVRTCPVCDYRTRNPEFAHCPRDGTPLEDADGTPVGGGGTAGGSDAEESDGVGWD